MRSSDVLLTNVYLTLMKLFISSLKYRVSRIISFIVPATGNNPSLPVTCQEIMAALFLYIFNHETMR